MNAIILRPIFVGGCERSGTTFIAKEIGAKLNVPVVPESQFFVQLYWLSKRYDNEKEEVIVKKITGFLRDNFRYKLWGLGDPAEVVVQCIKNNAFDVGLFMYKILLLYIGSDNNILTWIDHTPWNIRYGNRLKEIYPESRFIHLIRDGRAVASSLMKVSWGPTDMYSAAKYWMERIGLGLAMEGSMGADTVKRIFYEDFIENESGVLDKISEWIGVEGSLLQDDYLVPEYKVSDYSLNQHKLVASKPIIDRIESWKSELCDAQVEEFEYYTGDLLDYLGYDRLYLSGYLNGSSFNSFKKYLKRFYKEFVVQKGLNFSKRRRVLKSGTALH